MVWPSWPAARSWASKSSCACSKYCLIVKGLPASGGSRASRSFIRWTVALESLTECSWAAAPVLGPKTGEIDKSPGAAASGRPVEAPGVPSVERKVFSPPIPARASFRALTGTGMRSRRISILGGLNMAWMGGGGNGRQGGRPTGRMKEGQAAGAPPARRTNCGFRPPSPGCRRHGAARPGRASCRGWRPGSRLPAGLGRP